MSAATIWFIIGVVFFLGELFSPVFVLFFFALGAWAAWIASLLGGELTVALATFITVSVVSLLVLRRLLVRTFKGRSRPASGDSAETGSPECLLAGRLGSVTLPIHPGAVGEISVGGSFWRAVAEQDIAEGTTVKVTGHEKNNELVLKVVPHEPGKE